ncbi:nucleotidyl transferase AbiEii/AbiGii toxin family protein [bacterium]|nr:nucleotidyl transferase AbiEii/AbiGii toxin family protein [bacterium]
MSERDPVHSGLRRWLLHFRRTFVEKLFAIHAKVELYLRNGEPIGTYSRHYYDLYQLGQRQEVLEMLRSDEYTQIKEDYERISLRHYRKSYFRPDQMSFSNSRALFPQGELAERLGENYQRQCQILCFGPFPPWNKVLQLFEDLRADL